jgi:hypothetical protein
MEMKVQLANPVLVFVYSLFNLLFGCAIGMHWYKNPGSAVWVAICGALLMVIHDLAEGFIWFGVTARMLKNYKKLTEGR